MTTTEAQLREALEDIASTAQAASQQDPEQFCEWAYMRASDALALPSQRPDDDFERVIANVEIITCPACGLLNAEHYMRPDDEGVDEHAIGVMIFTALQNCDLANMFTRHEKDAQRKDAVYEAIRPYLRAKPDAGLLDPEMPSQELKLHMGELTTQEERTARAAIRWANTRHTCAGADNKQLKQLMEAANRDIAASGGPYDVSLLRSGAPAGKGVVGADDVERVAIAIHKSNVMYGAGRYQSAHWDKCKPSEKAQWVRFAEAALAALAQNKASDGEPAKESGNAD